MNKGRTLEQLAQEIMRQQQTKRDFVADTRQITFNQNGTIQLPTSATEGNETFPINPIAHGQIASRLKIPKAYYDRCLNEAPALLANNVNHWFTNQPEKRLIRTLDGNARGFLSDRFRRLDHFDICDVLLPQIINGKQQATFLSTQITEKKMYLKLIFESTSFEVSPGDKVYFGKTIANSEVGHGSFSIEDFFYRTFCKNGCTFSGGTLRKYHVGRGLYDNESDMRELLSDETKSTTDKAFWMQLKDIWEHSIAPENFQERMNQLTAAKEDKMAKPVVEVVELAAKKFNLSEDHGKSMLMTLAKEGDFSRWGLANAVTAIANDIDDYEQAHDLEKLGGKILALTAGEWRSIAA